MAGLKQKLLSSVMRINVKDVTYFAKQTAFIVSTWVVTWHATDALLSDPVKKFVRDAQSINPTLLGTGVSNRLTPPAFLNLEKEALKLEDAATLARYETAVLDKYFPEFSYNGAPRYIVQVRENLDDGTRVKEAFVRSLSTPQTTFNSSSIKQALGDVLNGFMIDGYTQNQSADVDKTVPNSAGNVSPYFNPAYSGEKAFFAAANFSRSTCRNCEDNKHQFDCTTAVDPIGHRDNQLFRFQTAEHEVAHALSYLSGANSARKKISTDQNWLYHAEENAAGAYAALRIVSKFGAEGLGFLKLYRKSRARQINTEIDQTEYQDFLEHWHILTLNNVITRYDDHPELLKDKTPPELFALAQELIRPLSPAALAELRALDMRDLKKGEQAEVKFNALVGKTAHPDTALFLEYQVGNAKRLEIFGMDEKMRAQIKQMPHASPSYGKDLFDYSDEELLDLAQFDAERRQGTSCSMGGYIDRFKKTYQPGHGALARIKGITPPHLK